MDPISAIIGALAAGATAALKDAASEAIKNAYAALKTLLAGKLVSLTTLEEDPSDEDYRSWAYRVYLQKKRPGLITSARACSLSTVQSLQPNS